MGGVRALAASFVLLAACCAFPTMPSTDSSAVVLLSEAPDENLWFDTLEKDRPAGERVIGDSRQSLGDSLPSPDEETFDMPGERGTVKNDQSDPKQPQRNPRLPEEVRNPFGQMVQDLEDMKTGEKELDLQHKRYRKMKYYAASTEEQNAVQEALTASEGMASSEYPDPHAEEIAQSANEDLVRAIKHRQKLELEGSKEFTHTQRPPVPDQPNKDGTGPFAKLYKLNLHMKKNEDEEKNLQQQFKAKPVPVRILRELYPNKRERRQQRSEDDKYYAYHMSKDHFDPTKSKAYHDAHEKALVEDQLMGLLSEAAKTYKSRKLTEPHLKYADTVKGTSLQGITNFYAMSPDELAHQTKSFALQSTALNKHERDLDKMQEDYLQKYDDETRIVPFAEWEKQWTLERMVNAEVHDPDNPVTEKMIKEDSAKLLQEHLHPDLEADVQTLLKARKDAETEADEGVARVVSQAPTKETLEKLKKENILGAKQLEADTKLANERLANETAHPHHYGRHEKLQPDKEPSYASLKHEADLKESRELVKKNQKALLVDAKRLAKTGDRVDQMVLEHDTKAALQGRPTDDDAQKHSVITEQLYYDMLRSQYGNETMEDMKAGVQAQLKKQMSKWSKVKNVVLNGGVGPDYGAEALKSLPTRSSGPELDPGSSISFEGNTANANVPARKDDIPDNGMGRLPEDSKDIVKVSVEQQAAEERPRTGYAPEEEDTPTDQETKANVVSIEARAEKEATAVEDETSPKVYNMKAKSTPTDKAADETIDSAEGTEKVIAHDTDSKQAAKEVNDVLDDKRNVAVAEQDDHPQMWNTKEAAAEINQAMKHKNQANAHENSGIQQNNDDDGVPA